jgi:glycine/D-amino acid oxidase-like deaminating enzyme
MCVLRDGRDGRDLPNVTTAAARSRPRLRFGVPVWLADEGARPRARYPKLRGRQRVDVAIVGGGFTGAVMAHTFASAGVSVALVEGALTARGSTAASAALLLQEPDLGLARLATRHGSRAARRIWELSHASVDELVSLIRGLRIPCDLVERDTIYIAAKAEHARGIGSELRRRVAAGFRGEWLTPPSLLRRTNISASGGIRTSGNAQFDPLAACAGLISAAAKAGARVFERSRVRRIAAHGNGVRLYTPHGQLDASRIVVATGYATRYFRPLTGRFRMYRTFVLATAPLSRAQRRAVGLGDVMLWDSNRPYHYLRWTPDHRLLLGGGDRPLAGGERRGVRLRRAASRLRSEFTSMLPALSDVEIDCAWEGLFAITPDGLPFIGPHRRYPHHLFALGYGGNGMAFTPLAARMILEHHQGIRSPDHDLFAFGRFG